MCQEGLFRLALSSPRKQTACSLGERRTLAEALGLVDSTLESRRDPNSSLQKEFPQHQDEDQSRAAVPQDCLLRDVECIAQKLEASLEEIHRGAREPREEREQRTLGDALENARLEIEKLKDNLMKLKESGTTDLQRAREHNQRLDEEILALRNRVRSLDSEKKVLGEMVSVL